MRKTILAFATMTIAMPALAQQLSLHPTTSMTVSFGSGTSGTFKIVDASTEGALHITKVEFRPVTDGNVSISYGTGDVCSSGTKTFLGPAKLTAGQPVHMGTGDSAILDVPPGNDICVTVDANTPGNLTYAQ